MKKYLLCLCVFLCVSGSHSPALAQKQGLPLIDSLVKELAKMSDDTNKVALLNNLSFAYYSENPDEGIRYGMQSINLAEELGWDKGLAKAYRSIGINYENKGAYPVALNYFFKALKINEAMKDTLNIAKTTSTIGIIYDDQKDYAKALGYYNTGLNIFEKLNDKPNIAVNLGNIALVYWGLKNIPMALRYDTLALNMYSELEDKGGIARSIGNLGMHFMAAGDLAKSLTYSLRALDLYREQDNKYGLALTYGSMGELYYVLATDTASSVRNTALQHGSKDADLKTAATYMAQSIAIAKASGYLDLVCNNGNTFAYIQEKQGNYKGALASYRDYALLKDSVFNDESRMKIQSLITQREIDLKDKQIELDKLAVAKKRNERVFYIIGIGLLLVVLGVITRNYRIQKKLNDTITTLVSEQEITIAQRTQALTHANEKLLGLIQFNAHNVREPLARVMGTIMMRGMIDDAEFLEEYWPLMEQSVTDLDNTLKDVIEAAEKQNL